METITSAQGVRRLRAANYPDFRELAGLRIDLNRPAMLLHDDVVTDGEAESSAFPSRFGREKWIEHLFLHARRNATTIVADRYLNTVAKAFGSGSKGRLVVAAVCFRTALRCSIK